MLNQKDTHTPIEFIIKPNPNEEIYKEVSEAVKTNDNYCCCEIEKNEDTLCMCKNFRESQDTDFCHCERFYKVKNYTTLAVVGDISDEDGAQSYIDWCEILSYQDFIVIGIPLNMYDYHCNSAKYINLSKAAIAKADALVVLGHNQELTNMVETLVDWASAINKKILTREDLKV